VFVKKRPSIISTLLRCLRLRCPVCGESPIVQRPFKIKHHCPSCDALFMREAGFFVGAILINVVTTEAVILLVYVVCLLLGLNYEIILAVLFATALLFPVIFYHHSWSIWLAFDHLVETLPKNTGQTRGRV
jgi:uncharacterized protein (DUF983 family)